MERRVKPLVAERLGVEMRGRAQGSNALAQLIIGGNIHPDLFISVTPSPMLAILRARKATVATPIARTAVVVAYRPAGRFASAFVDAAAGKSAWWRVLQEPGLRFGRTDPRTDPQGRNIVFALRLAALEYGQPDLAQRVLGAIENPQQIFEEATVEARLQSGVNSMRRRRTKCNRSPLVCRISPCLRRSISAMIVAHPSTDAFRSRSAKPRTSTCSSRSSSTPGEVLTGRAQSGIAARAFVEMLTGGDGQELFRRAAYDPPAGASELRG